MRNRFAQTLAERSLSLRRARPEILQVNVGKLCNLTCLHCHVNAGPKRKEIMSRETIDRIIEWFGKTDIPTIDLTGGAPEMIPDFCYFIKRVKELHPSRHVIDRCNLTILLEPEYEDLATFLASHKVEDRKSTRLNSSHGYISYAVFCLEKKKNYTIPLRAADIKGSFRFIKIVATSSMVQVALAAAKLLEEEDISAEVIDPRTIWPLDEK